MKKNLEFIIEGSDLEKLKKFQKEHKNCITKFPNMTGANFEYTFIPDGLGLFKTVECVCGKRLNLASEYELSFDDENKEIIPKIENIAPDDTCRNYLKWLFNIYVRPGLFFGSTKNICYNYIAILTWGYRMALNPSPEAPFSKLEYKIQKSLSKKMWDKDFKNTPESFDLYFENLIKVIEENYPQYKDLIRTKGGYMLL